MKKGLIALAVASCVASVNASAELSYNYVEGGLAMYPSADGDQSFIGLEGRGSMEISEELFGFGGLKYLTDDFDYMGLHVGGGYKVAIDNRTDVWVGGSLEYQKFDSPRRCAFGFCVGGSENETSIGLRGGMRMEVNNQLEVAGSGRYVLGDFDHLGITGTARYMVQDNLVVFGEADFVTGEYDLGLGLIGGITFFF